MDSKVLTIMLTDMKGFTESSSRRSRDDMMKLVQRHDSLLRPIVEGMGGRIWKTIGDAFLVAFESPTNAVLAGLVMQHTLKEYNATVKNGERIEVRIAINVGEVQLTTDDIYGEAVNLASRINAVTEPGEVYFTNAVYLAMNKQEVPSSEIGETRFKGIAEPVRLFKVLQDPASDQYRKAIERAGRGAQKPSPAEKMSEVGLRPARPRARTAAVVAVVVALAAAAAGAVLLRGGGWSGKVRAFIASGGYNEAWQLIDERFREKPGDPELVKTAMEVAEAEAKSVAARDGYEEALKRLAEHRAKRDFLKGLDELILRTKREWAVALGASERRTERNQGVNLLAEVARARAKDAGAYCEYAKAYAALDNAAAWTTAAIISKAVGLDEKKALDPWVKETLTKIAREGGVPPDWTEAAEFADLVARLYGAEMKAELLAAVVRSGKPEPRVTAFEILGRLGKLPEETVFEYQRLNLFEGEGKRLEKAAEYFKGWLDRKDEAAKFVGDRKFDSIPVFDRYESRDADAAREVVSALFYAPCKDFLLSGALALYELGRRWNCFKVLSAHGDVTPELEFRYHLINLDDYDAGQLRYRYRYLTEAFDYLKSGRVAGDERRAEALKLVDSKIKMLSDAKANRYVQKDEDVVKWLEGQLQEARTKLAGAR